MKNQPDFWRFRFLSACLLALAASAICTRASWAAEESEWKLRQHIDFLGEFDVYVSHDAIKAVNLTWGYEVTSRAPAWTVRCFNKKEKLEWSGDLSNFSGMMLTSPFEESGFNTERLQAVGGGTLKGLKYTRYSPSKTSLSALYGADDISVAPMGATFLSRLWDFPLVGKVPIYRCRYKRPAESKSVAWIATEAGSDLRSGLVIEFVTKSWKKLPYKSLDFDCPRGYKRLNRLSDISYGSGRKDNVTDVLGSLTTPTNENDDGKSGALKNKAKKTAPVRKNP